MGQRQSMLNRELQKLLHLIQEMFGQNLKDQNKNQVE